MTKEKNKATKLSVNVRKMKFMQRCMSESEKRELEESEKIITSEHWELDLPEMQEPEKKFVSLHSLTHCQPCRYGRMSFGGFNKAIEKLMTEWTQEKESNGRDSDISISDDEMAHRYSSLVGTIRNKFNTKSRKSISKEPRADATTNNSNEVDSPQVKRTKLDRKQFLKPSE